MSEPDRAVLIDHAVLARIRRIAEKAGFRREVGGVLLGSYRGGHLHVTDATAPQSADRWSRTRFWRSPQGHQDIAEAAWARSGGLITYVGEWHSHPETWPSPSLLDRSSWLKSRHEQGRALTFVIVGRRDVCVCAIADAGGVRRLQRIDDDGAGALYGEASLKPSPPLFRDIMTEPTLVAPDDWRPHTLDHAVARYANRTDELFYFSMKGHGEAVRHAYEDVGGPGQWWIPTLSNSLLKAIALTLNSQWQNDVVEWLCETQAFGPSATTDFSKFRRNAAPDEVEKHVRRMRGSGIVAFPEFPVLRELHLVANTVRHGPGRSLVDLHRAHPELWPEDTQVLRLRPWFIPDDEPLPHFVLRDADLERYNTAICRFWRRIAQAGLKKSRSPT